MATLEFDSRRALTDSLNELIKHGVNTNDISDGHHTFGELYEHRIQLFIALCKTLCNMDAINAERQGYPFDYKSIAPVWRSKKHSDGTEYEGWFLLGVSAEAGKQITYHLPISKWGECIFAFTLEKAPEFDGHTSTDVLKRLKNL